MPAEAAPPVDPEHPAAEVRGSSDWLFILLKNVWTSQIEQWDQSARRLREAAANLPADARTFVQNALSFFKVSNEGYVGETATQRHVTVLASSFNLWVSDYQAGLDNCATTLREGLDRFRRFHADATQIVRTTPDDGTPVAEQITRAFQMLSVTRCDYLKPVNRDYLPPRSGPAETLGPFGVAARWLLRTESQELALIIGLLGFGFFGALATSFIREFEGTPGNELPTVGFIVPALVRGIGAAMLIFLLAKGGTAILTRGDAALNAYAIFFACFVAAVFSDDVWRWARTRQRRQFTADRSTEHARIVQAAERKGSTRPPPGAGRRHDAAENRNRAANVSAPAPEDAGREPGNAKVSSVRRIRWRDDGAQYTRRRDPPRDGGPSSPDGAP